MQKITFKKIIQIECCVEDDFVMRQIGHISEQTAWFAAPPDLLLSDPHFKGWTEIKVEAA